MHEKEQLWSLHFGSDYSPIIFNAVKYEVSKYLSLLEYCVVQRHISGAMLLPERQRMGSEMYQLHRIESS